MPGAGGVSLLLPSEPSYDPLAWLIWGRELAQFHLDTSGGPSWKPLPVVFTTITAPFGKVDQGLPPALWMAVARAAALLAMALAFRLAHRLACLLRPELVPFLGLYGLWVWRAEPRLRKLLAGTFVLLPVLWAGPEWIGSGMPLDGGAQARSEPAWSLSLADRPWLRALERVHNHAGLPLELLAALAVAVALLRRQAAILALAAAAAVEVALFVAMTQAGFSGNPRYVLPRSRSARCSPASERPTSRRQCRPLSRFPLYTPETRQAPLSAARPRP